MKRVGIIGAGAAGIFAAISIKEKHPNYSVTVFEKQADILQKVKISGGGRCNVTHACFDFKELVDYYPRGGKGLLSLFSQFQPGDTMDWFESRGVELKKKLNPTAEFFQKVTHHKPLLIVCSIQP